MATTNEVSKAVQAAPKAISVQDLINKSVKELGRALPDHMSAERLARIALTSIRLNPKLGQCTTESFIGALFTAAQIGIEPVGGRAYILPYQNNRKKADGSWHSVMEAQFQLGYKGVAELFYRHEKAVELAWGIVHEKDEFSYELGTGATLKHKPAMKDRGAPIAYWVMATLNNGGKPFAVMSYDDCRAHGLKHSKSVDKKTGNFQPSSPWATSFDSMALKTVLVQLAKLLPLSVELQRAIATDETSRDFRAGIENALDLPDTTDWTKDAVDVKAEPSTMINEAEAGTAQEPD
jgi:recombination protein RecT